jgi:hypothetical protein
MNFRPSTFPAEVPDLDLEEFLEMGLESNPSPLRRITEIRALLLDRDNEGLVPDLGF